MRPARTFVATICIVTLPLTAIAQGKSNDRGNGNRGNNAAAQESRRNGNRGGDDNATREIIRGNGISADARANPSRGFCPPGLRRQGEGCVPPGQAAQDVTAQEWSERQGYRFVAGAPLDDADYTPLPNYADFDLPQLDARETYAVINRTAVVIDPATNTFLKLASR